MLKDTYGGDYKFMKVDHILNLYLGPTPLFVCGVLGTTNDLEHGFIYWHYVIFKTIVLFKIL